ncbi:MAG: HAD family phosphatase [Verrucomicrobiaceae bacterium]|nr:HAD family phosphatase [Verrucomicrobiaceae bacterium]
MPKANRHSQLLLCFDFDGTFIDPSSPSLIDPSLKQALDEMRQRGALFVINTGRSLFDAVTGINQSGLRDFPDYLITCEREIHEPNAFRRWIDLGNWNKHCRKDHEKLFHKHRKLLQKITDFVEKESNANWIAEPEEPAGIIASNNGEMDDLCTFIDKAILNDGAIQLSYERNSIYLRFSHALYNKGSALKEIGRKLKIKPSSTFAIGDNYNDLTMLQENVASMISCPGNSIPEIKEEITKRGGYVARESCGAGVAEAIAYFFTTT